jgi:hypothetical protein
MDILSKKHEGMKVSARGVLGRIAKGWAVDKGLQWTCGELLEHLQEMGKRYYGGDVKAVDEFLQLYCLDEGREEAVKKSKEDVKRNTDVVCEHALGCQQRDCPHIRPHTEICIDGLHCTEYNCCVRGVAKCVFVNEYERVVANS